MEFIIGKSKLELIKGDITLSLIHIQMCIRDSGSPDAFLNAWLNSPSHRANILRAQYNKIGVGMIENGDRRVVTTVFSN